MVALLIAIGIFLFFLFLWPLFAEFTLKESRDFSEIIRNYGLLIGGGLAGGIGLHLAWKRTTAAIVQADASSNQAKAALTHAQAANRQSRTAANQLTAVGDKALEDSVLARETHVTELFTKAIDQLGSENLSVRLGGIYALERIANESERDFWPIMQVLSAFIKERCPLRETSGDSQQTLIDETIISSGGTHYHFDVQGALSVIGRRNEKFDDVNGDLDLSDADLRNANFNDGNFGICNFFNSNLSEAWFMDSNFEGGKLSFANLTNCTLVRANFSEAELSFAEMHDSKLTGTNLCGADLVGAKGLTEEQINEAIIDENTKLPEELQHLTQK